MESLNNNKQPQTTFINELFALSFIETSTDFITQLFDCISVVLEFSQ